MRKAVFLDRDGVINKADVRNGRPYPPKNLGSLSLCRGVITALRKLNMAEYLLIIITNQPDVARGISRRRDVEAINSYLLSKLPIIDVFSCFHDNDDYCSCRKPLPGNIISAAKKYSINLSASFMIGDRWKDIDAGSAAGCTTIFIDCDYDEKISYAYDHKVRSISEAAKIILGNR